MARFESFDIETTVNCPLCGITIPLEFAVSPKTLRSNDGKLRASNIAVHTQMIPRSRNALVNHIVSHEEEANP